MREFSSAFANAESRSKWLPDNASRCVIAQTARGLLPTMAVICAKVFSLPLPPRVQKNATSGSWLAAAIRYARTGELSDQAQTGVPMTTRSYDETSCFFRCNDGRSLPPRFQDRPYVTEKTSPGFGLGDFLKVAFESLGQSLSDPARRSRPRIENDESF